MTGKEIHGFGIKVMWAGGIVLIGTMMGYFSGIWFFFILTFCGYMIVRHGCSEMAKELELDPQFQKALKLLSDENYETAQKMVVEDSRNNPEPEHLFDNAVWFLEQKGIPKDEAVTNLWLINRALIEARDKIEILRDENLHSDL